MENSYGRRTWDEKEYALKARQRREEAQKRRNGTNTGLKAHEFYQDRRKKIGQINSFSNVKVVSANGSKEAGFYCELCRRHFQDNLKFIEHLNSKEHLANSGFEGDSNSYTLEDVKKRLQYLKEKVTGKRVSEHNQSKKPKKQKVKHHSTEADSEIAKVMGFSKFS